VLARRRFGLPAAEVRIVLAATGDAAFRTEAAAGEVSVMTPARYVAALGRGPR
jgi:hypothetical protein